MIAAAKLVAQIVAFLLTSATSEHTPPTECATYNQIEYCYYKGNSRNLVYFMHGFGNDIRAWSWNPVSGKIEQSWKKAKKKPHVVTISFDKFWMYHEVQNPQESLDRFVHWFEQKKLNDNIDKRYLYGDSMGGYNAISWISERPYFFDALALICPAISKSMTDNPNGSYTGLKWLSPLADKLFFNEQVNSDKLLQKKIADITKKNDLSFVYLAAMTTDELGFYPGNLYLKNSFINNGITNLVWQEQMSRHCNIDPTRLASLLLQ